MTRTCLLVDSPTATNLPRMGAGWIPQEIDEPVAIRPVKPIQGTADGWCAHTNYVTVDYFMLCLCDVYVMFTWCVCFVHVFFFLINVILCDVHVYVYACLCQISAMCMLLTSYLYSCHVMFMSWHDDLYCTLLLSYSLCFDTILCYLMSPDGILMIWYYIL